MKINIKNETKTTEVLENCQKKCIARTTYYEDVQQAIKKIEAKLDAFNVPKKNWLGAQFYCQPHMAQFPASYKYSPTGTAFSLEYCSSGWFLVNCGRSYCQGSEKRAIEFVNESNYKEFYSFS